MYRIANTTRFPLAKVPGHKRATPRANGQRQPRQQHGSYLDLIRGLPCLVSGMVGQTEAAHVRFGDLSAGKRPTGLGEKPHDMWVVPLSAHWHRLSQDAQHQCGEREWWNWVGIDPIEACQALWAARDDFKWMEEVADLYSLNSLPEGSPKC